MARLILIEAVHPLDEVAPSISLGYLSSYILKYFKQIEIQIHRSTGNIPLPLTDGDIVGITSFTQNYNSALRLAANIKRAAPSVPVIIGGNHVSFLPESMSQDMDVAVIGEGEETLLDLMKLWFDGPFNRDGLRQIAGLAFRENGDLVRTQPRVFCEDLDRIPPPARFLTHSKSRYDRCEIITSRGCPYKCIYCGSSALWRRIRFHSVEYVIAELDQVIETYNPRQVLFVDDLFVARKDRFSAIMDHIRRKGYNKRMSFYFTAHANLVTPELCETMHGVTCTVAMGLETGSDRVLKQIKSGAVSVEKNRQAVELLASHANIKPAGAFMVGLPGETLEDMEMTYGFLKSNPLSVAAVSVVTPFPGTQLWADALRSGKVNVAMDWERLRFNSKTSLAGKVIIDEAVSVEDLEVMFHKINNYCYTLMFRNVSLVDIVMNARVSIPFIFRNLIGNPRKVFNILLQGVGVFMERFGAARSYKGVNATRGVAEIQD